MIKVSTIDPLEKAAEFAPLGWITRRCNYDGTAVSPTRNLTWNTPVNLSEQLNEGKYPITLNKKGYLITAIDNEAPVLSEIDFSGALDMTKVTPAEMVIALNNANIEHFSASIDNQTGATNFKCVKSGVKFVQIFGVLAGAMGFGGGHAYTNYGIEFSETIKNDESITSTPTLSRTENQNVDQTASQNGLTRVVVSGQITGIAYALTVKPIDYRLRQIFEGGKLVVKDDGVHYYPPRSAANFEEGETNVEFWEIDPLYTANAESEKGNERGFISNHCFRAKATVGDKAGGAMTLTSYNFNLTAGTYIDEKGNKISQPEEIKKNLSQWQEYGLTQASQNRLSLNMLDIINLINFTLQSAINLTTGQSETNPVVIDPDNANNYAVSFSPLQTLTDTVLSWNDETYNIEIVAGQITGTETIIVRFTNRDGSFVEKPFNLTIA